jgi:excinuclease ABC subunit A
LQALQFLLHTNTEKGYKMAKKSANNTIESLNSKEFLIIKGAHMHNLKHIDLALPRNKMIVFTGLSGSGKSSLAFDTIYAEGQRRYVESLSSYARQFLGRLEKPKVDYIKGISPAIAIEQKVISRNPRSTVGTVTEVYDYMKLLYARIGKIISPISGQEVKRNTVSDVVKFILKEKDETIIFIAAPIALPEKRNLEQHLDILKQQGFLRLLQGDTVIKIENFKPAKKENLNELYLLIDRISIDHTDEDQEARLGDSVQTAFYEANNTCLIFIKKNDKLQKIEFSNRLELDGITFEAPSIHFFTFNNPVGACKKCEGFGSVIGIDENLVIPNRNLSVYEEAIACWKGETMSNYKKQFINAAHKHNFPIHKPINELTKAQSDLLWEGGEGFWGINAFFKDLESQTYKIQYRVLLARYRGKTNCPECKGTRLRKDANYVKVNDYSISELILQPISELKQTFEKMKFSEFDKKVSTRLLLEINNRLNFLCDVGLGYLTLNRVANTLSGGESQRINLATSLGSSLVGSLYILDEPSIGLHPRDNERLIKVLQDLNRQGNTLIIVEHDEEIMKAAHQLVDIGPMAGVHGGNIVFQGVHEQLIKSKDSLTADYLTGKKEIAVPKSRRSAKHYIHIKGASENNLKNLSLKIPLQMLTVITGVSGSGKSTLIKKIVYPQVKRILEGAQTNTEQDSVYINQLNCIKNVEFVDQNPIGKSSRSNPVTYVKAFDEIRTLYADQQISKLRGYKPSHFSFNVEGGRCDVCEGEGLVTIEMQFMADLQLTCENCKGRRYKSETLEVYFREKNISDILNLTVDEAIELFNEDKSNICKRIVDKLLPLQHVGLGYLGLGQASSTLSGGEAQRIKLASFLALGENVNNHTLFIFDEPTTGLHFHDINKLLDAFYALIKKGHSIIVIEHNLDVIKCADFIIDLGPEGGEAGGNLVFAGLPENLVKEKSSYTGKYLKTKL